MKASATASSTGRWRWPRPPVRLVIGASSLRTRGVYFIMITLAFAQMAYYSSRVCRLWRRRRPHHLQAQRFRRPHQPVEPRQFYYLCLACCSADLSGLAHRQFALRPGGAGPALQRSAHAGNRLSRRPATGWFASSSPARVRPRRRAARQQHRFVSPAVMTGPVPAN